MKEKIIVSTCTLAGSLLSYYYARVNGKDVMPYTMIGGFIGAMIGEIIMHCCERQKDKDQ